MITQKRIWRKEYLSHDADCVGGIEDQNQSAVETGSCIKREVWAKFEACSGNKIRNRTNWGKLMQERL